MTRFIGVMVGVGFILLTPPIIFWFAFSQSWWYLILLVPYIVMTMLVFAVGDLQKAVDARGSRL